MYYIFKIEFCILNILFFVIYIIKNCLDDPPPYIDGMRINSPHYLCKIKLNDESDAKYTLVISQYEKTNTIYYTLRAYGTCPFILRKIPQLYKYEKEVHYLYKYFSRFFF